MGPSDLLIHLANFVAPALALAVLLTGAVRIFWPGRAAGRRLWAQFAIVFAAGVAVLACGLWWFGRDGKMATYGALVVVAASVQWLLAGAWRR